MELAARLVQAVATKYDEKAQARKIFGGLCHSFPIMVRTCGLCQALAFSFDKATVTDKTPSPRNEAHGLLLDHVSELLLGPDRRDRVALLDCVRGGDVAQYMFDTRRVLAAWVYWKRFAVSILKVESARDAEDGENE
jgi:CRISPR-associated protein Cmr5